MGVVDDAIKATLREFAESNMDHAVRIERGHVALDPDTLVAAWSVDLQVYAGKARVHLVVPAGTVELGEGQVAQQQGSVSIPMDAPVPIVDDILVVTAQDDDPTLVGTSWRVLGAGGGGSHGAFRPLTVTAWSPSSVWGPA